MNRTVFVGDLSYFTNEVHLMQYMSTVGKVVSVQILRGSCGESLLHGFVKFENDQSAVRAVQKLHNVKFMGRRLIVNSTNTKAPKKPYHLWHKFTLHFTTDAVFDVTEDMLDHICSPFGEIGDCVVRSQVTLNPPEVGMAGYAVVFYLELASAQRAFEYIQKKTINHITFTCSFTTQSNPMSSASRRAMNPNAQQPGSHSRIQVCPKEDRYVLTPPESNFVGYPGVSRQSKDYGRSLHSTPYSNSFAPNDSFVYLQNCSSTSPKMSSQSELFRLQQQPPPLFQCDSDIFRPRLSSGGEQSSILSSGSFQQQDLLPNFLPRQQSPTSQVSLMDLIQSKPSSARVESDTYHHNAPLPYDGIFPSLTPHSQCETWNDLPISLGFMLDSNTPRTKVNENNNLFGNTSHGSNSSISSIESNDYMFESAEHPLNQSAGNTSIRGKALNTFEFGSPMEHFLIH
eukprot:CAMPEP_0202965154 /NCGR_PEP_ID=MMETSP1396-20130829/9227_1 /ASSEMBLY_ACC=CAM_ASM_000872 /TAXON_ID= /ORGANISM="Pseudokeronopsis sp., Strain Brazil" /LENGTH=455 /DNA_ID=CAMNT_0049687785 /DNA_START=69 /DNA_END=1436 /DNA_ORIENTATION=+